MSLVRRLVLAVLAAGLCSPPVQAQSAAELLEQGIRAYQDLEFDAAAALLRRALVPDPAAETEPRVQADALAYLAATEFFRGRPVSASTAYRRLVRFDPRYRPDQLVFPPEVTNLFEETRRQTKAIKVDLERDVTIRVGLDRFSMRLLSSSLHDVRAEIRAGDGTTIRQLYNGPIADSLDLGWDGHNGVGEVALGGHFLNVASLDDDGRVLGVVQIPLAVARVRIDTLPHPARPADSLFLPEIRASGPGLEALAGGVLGGVAVVALPTLFASGSEPSGARFAVGGVVSIAGVVGFLSRRPGEPLPANVAANEVVRRDWRQRVSSVEQENVRRRADVRLRLTAGRPLADQRN